MCVAVSIFSSLLHFKYLKSMSACLTKKFSLGKIAYQNLSLSFLQIVGEDREIMICSSTYIV